MQWSKLIFHSLIKVWKAFIVVTSFYGSNIFSMESHLCYQYIFLVYFAAFSTNSYAFIIVSTLRLYASLSITGTTCSISDLYFFSVFSLLPHTHVHGINWHPWPIKWTSIHWHMCEVLYLYTMVILSANERAEQWVFNNCHFSLHWSK
jgi:hypothetical protein